VPNNQFKSYVGEVPRFVPRGGAVHIELGGREVSAMPVETFLAATDAAAAVAAQLRDKQPVPIGRKKRA
jgi:hypothetical protein